MVDDKPRPVSLITTTLQGERATSVALAHDLCNHLQVISSALGLIQRYIGGDAAAALDLAFVGARTSLERAGRLGRAIVDAGRSQVPMPYRISIGTRLAALREFLVLASGPNIRIGYAVHQDVPDIHCAGEHLDDAILNIVVNACRAMPRGGRISITAMREIAPPDYLPCAVLRIADTGCGMSPEIVARAFEPRFTTRTAGEGSGIGLAMVAAFARSAGGSAGIESRPGVGTVVIMRLPGLNLPSARPPRKEDATSRR